MCHSGRERGRVLERGERKRYKDNVCVWEKECCVCEREIEIKTERESERECIPLQNIARALVCRANTQKELIYPEITFPRHKPHLNREREREREREMKVVQDLRILIF